MDLNFFTTLQINGLAIANNFYDHILTRVERLDKGFIDLLITF